MGSSRGRGRPSLEIDEEAVLHAALIAFAEQGYESTSMERIAERCGIAKTTLHDRFGGKNAIFERALAQEHERFAQHLLAAYAEAAEMDMQAQLRHGFRAFLIYARDNPVTFSYIFGEQDGRTLHSSSATRGRELVLEAITTMVETQARAAGRTTGLSSMLTADVILGTGEYVARRVATDPTIDIEAANEFVVEAIGQGIYGVGADRAAALDAEDPTGTSD